jgi:hypothetical protein
MIDFTTDINEDLEKTQRLPVLSADAQLDEALRRERAVRIQIVELMRQNLQQAQELERHVTTEERLFEVCGAFKDTLSKVLRECRTRGLALHCEGTAHRALEDCCDTLEQILSDPGFSAPAGARRASDEARPARVPRLAVVRSAPAKIGQTSLTGASSGMIELATQEFPNHGARNRTEIPGLEQ